MIDSSPIDSWEGAAAIFTFASGGAGFWFWVMCALCLVPIFVSLKAENAAEKEHG